MRRIFPLLLVVMGFELALSGCSSWSYYRQAAAGQWRLLQASRPVADVLADPATPPPLRRQLELARELRAFASRDLALPDNASYRGYADLRRPYAVRNVFAAPELSLEPRQWCFWLVGCLNYRGYFEAKGAEQLAAALRAEGDDVYVADIPAYSTLGWFGDPLLNTFIHWPTGRLAELLFHELAHQRVYVADDSAFNEAFATTVGRLGAQRWLERRGSATEHAQFLSDQRKRQAFFGLTTIARERLATVYASSRPDAEKRTEKQRVLAELRGDYQTLWRAWGDRASDDRRFARDLNNARLAGISTYQQWVPAFEALFERAGRDFAAFYRAVEALGSEPPARREARLRALLRDGDPSMLARDVPAPSG